MRRYVLCCAILTSFCYLTSVVALAQNPRGSLQGEVQDTTGARVNAATIIVSDPQISAERTAQTNSQGEFRIDDLAPGNYHIVVKATGFADAAADTKVVVTSVRDVMVTLRPAQVQQSVNVTSAEGSSITTQPFDTTRTVQQGIVTSQDLRDIPLAARSFANIAYMAPGTEPVEPSDPTKARITAVSFGGSSGLERATLRRWRRQYRRLYWRVPTELLA